MKKVFYILMIIIGTCLVGIFTYVLIGFSTANPLFRWAIFVEPMIFSSLLILIGVLLTVLGIVFLKRLKKKTVHQ